VRNADVSHDRIQFQIKYINNAFKQAMPAYSAVYVSTLNGHCKKKKKEKGAGYGPG